MFLFLFAIIPGFLLIMWIYTEVNNKPVNIRIFYGTFTMFNVFIAIIMYNNLTSKYLDLKDNLFCSLKTICRLIDKEKKDEIKSAIDTYFTVYKGTKGNISMATHKLCCELVKFNHADMESMSKTDE